MNQAFRLIWNELTHTWVAISEIAKAGGKRASGAVLLASVVVTSAHAGGAALPQAPPVQQLPVGGKVVSGSAAFAQNGNSLTVTQGSAQLITNWQSFNIGSQASVQFVQPSSSSVALNRVVGQDPTQILGKLSANGAVFLVNPAGIVFGSGSQVNVGALVASTLDIADTDFLNRRYQFNATSGPAASVSNAGDMVAAAGGVVAFIAPSVTNSGSISTPRGSTLLVAGSKVSVDFVGDGLITYTLDAGAVSALAGNSGSISADGGLVVLSAKAADAVSQAVVRNAGVIQAQTLQNQGGRILLMGDMQNGAAQVGGTLDASAPNGGNGGFIETSAAQVTVADSARITTLSRSGASGTWLIDPHDFTIASTATGMVAGGAPSGDISGSTLSAALGSGNVEILSSLGSTSAGAGNIHVNDTVAWSANTLTLTAANHIKVNAVMSATGAASLALNPATANGADVAVTGGTLQMGMSTAGTVNASTGNTFLGQINFSGAGSLQIGGTAYTVINSLGAAGSTSGSDLQGINGNLGGHYVLGSNIDASATSGWNSGAGFNPIGRGATFTGVLEGLGHTISGLTINRPSTSDVGLFSLISTGGAVRNVGLSTASVVGFDRTAMLAGSMDGANIGTSYASGLVTGNGGETGGLVGRTYNVSTITNSFSAGMVTGSSGAGNDGAFVASTSSGTTIDSSYSTANIKANYVVGGLVGDNEGTIKNSYATGTVTTYAGANGSGLGGLVGYNGGPVTNSYATGAVTAEGTQIGGFIGHNGGALTANYATGNVTGSGQVGGFIGMNDLFTQVKTNFATGNVVSTGDYAGGFAGRNLGIIANSYATGSVSGTTRVGGFSGTMEASQGPWIYNSYANGAVTGTSYVGAFVGIINNGLINNSFYQTGVNGALTGIGNVSSARNSTGTSVVAGTADVAGTTWGMSAAAMKVQANFTSATSANGNVNPGWDFNTTPIWGYGNIAGSIGNNNNGLPVLCVFTGCLITVYVEPVTGSSAYGTAPVFSYSLVNASGNAYTLTNASVIGSASYAGSPLLPGATSDAGNYTFSYSGGLSLTGAGSSNYSLAAFPTATAWTVNKATLTVTGTVAASKPYDGTTLAALSGGALLGTVNGDVLVLTQSGQFASKNAGTAIAITATDVLSGSKAGNYTLIQPTGLSASITPAMLTVSGTSVAAGKSYDGTTAATVSGGALSGSVYGSDAPVLVQAGTFATSNAGSNISVTATDSLTGAGAANYTLTQPTGLSASITPATLTVSGTSVVANKTYDGTTTATVSGGALSGSVYGSDAPVLVQAGTFATSNAGNNIGVTATDSLTGAGAANYTLAQPTGLSASITPATLTVGGTSVVANKTYDGTTTASISGGTLTGSMYGSDAPVLVQAGTFATSNAGSNISVTATDSLTGAGAANYTLAQPTGLSASITPATLTVSGATVVANKTYDGTTTAHVSGGALSGSVYGSDAPVLVQAGTFATSNAGSNIGVTATDSLTGRGAANYTLTQPTGLSASITPATLTVSGTSVVANKTYDGTTTATVSGGALSGSVYGSDAPALVQAGTFATSNAGSNISVTATDSLTGAGAGNYILAQPAGLKASITPATLTVSGTTVAANKTYDGTTTATVSGGALSGSVYGSDAPVLVQAGTFATSNAGNNISVTPTDSLTGAGAANYTLAQPGSVTANITPAVLTVSGTTVAGKTYDGTTDAVLNNGTLVGVFSGDTVTLSQSGQFVSRNAGTAVAVVANDSLGGLSASNYKLSQPTGLSAAIAPAALTVTGTTVQNKVYDGNANATLLGGSLQGVLAQDASAVGLVEAGTFASVNPANAIAVMANDSLTGSAAANYVLTQPSGLSANITASAYVPPPVSPSSNNSTPTLNPAGSSAAGEPSAVFNPAPILTSSTPGPAPTTAAASGLYSSLSFGEGHGTVSIQLSSNGDSAALTLSTGSVLASSAESVPVFVSLGTTSARQAGRLTITQQDRTIKVTDSAGSTVPIPTVNAASMNFVDGDVRLASGANHRISVGVSPQGALVVKVTAPVKAGLDDKQLTLVALAIAKQRLNVDVSDVKAVWIQVPVPQ